jgi:hypothetical protein
MLADELAISHSTLHLVRVLARPRDAVMGLLRRVTARRVPLYAVIAVSIASLTITIPAYFGTKTGVPWANFALTSICTARCARSTRRSSNPNRTPTDRRPSPADRSNPWPA